MELVPCVLRILSVQQVISQMGMHVLGCFFFLHLFSVFLYDLKMYFCGPIVCSCALIIPEPLRICSES